MHAVKDRLNFNPRPPWGGRLPCVYFLVDFDFAISIHALRGEGDLGIPYTTYINYISIHALRGEGDYASFTTLPKMEISIHALRGEGDYDGGELNRTVSAFQSTPSVGRATRLQKLLELTVEFQSTPSVGRATMFPSRSSRLVLFQSTPSVGRATIINHG